MKPRKTCVFCGHAIKKPHGRHGQCCSARCLDAISRERIEADEPKIASIIYEDT